MSDTLNSLWVGEAIEQIRTLAPRLNAATDNANAAVARVEKFLNDECSIGLPVRVKFKSADGFCVFLWYARIAGKYRIGLDAGEALIPWSNCQRRHKLEACDHLPRLLVQIAEAVETAIGGVEKGEKWHCKLASALDCPEGGEA